jgi:hypothetical protein
MNNRGIISALLIALSLLEIAAVAAPYPIITNPPDWSWSSLGSMAFVHSGQPTMYSDVDLKLLSKFPIVQFDKKENNAAMPGVSQEDRFIAAARQVKAVNNRTALLMYLNGLMNFPKFERLYNHTVANPSLLLHDAKGNLRKINGATVFDMRLPAMRKLFVADAQYGMASGAFNGVFIDRANWAEECTWAECKSLVPAQRQLFVELTATLGEGKITLAKEHTGVSSIDWQVANAAMTSDAFCSMYCHGCNTSVTPASRWTIADAQNCADSITTIANMSARGQLTEVVHSLSHLAHSLLHPVCSFHMCTVVHPLLAELCTSNHTSK